MPDIPVWTDCNQACVFCSNPGGEYRDQAKEHSFAALSSRLERHKAGLPTFAKFDQVKDYFTLSGGEPTLHPEFLRLLSHMKAEFPDRELRLLTNGRRLAQEAFTRSVLEAVGTPFEAAVLLCGPDAATHESIAGAAPGSFRQTVEGIENLLRLRGTDQRVEVRVILTKIQLPVLRATLEFIAGRFPGLDRIVLIFVEMEGRALWRLEEIKTTMTGCAEVLDSMYDLLRSFREARLYHFPLCSLPERLRPMAWRTLDVRKIAYMLHCRDCALRPECVGVHKSYVQHTGAADLLSLRFAGARA